MRRVVVTGLGLVTPLSNDVNDFWERSLKSESGVSRIDLIDTSEFKIKIGGQIKDWDLGDRVDKREAKRLDRFAQFSLAAAQDAVSDAGINFQELDAHRCGCILFLSQAPRRPHNSIVFLGPGIKKFHLQRTDYFPNGHF